MKLNDLVQHIPHTGTSDAEISAITYDSRKAAAGSLFVCLVGAWLDGHTYAASAYKNGCRAFLCEHALDLPADAAQIITADTRAALAVIGADFYGNPADQLHIIGITGTKGKTTTALLTAAIMTEAGLPCAYIGSNGVDIAGVHEATANTTPESLELHRLFRKMLDANVHHVVLEVSSQALRHNRVDGIPFEVVAFTNLSEDHIGPGEHSSFEEYRSWKGKLFQRCDVGVVNADDPNTEALLEGHTCKLVTYGIHAPKVDYRASEQYRLLRNKEMLGVEFTLTEPDGHTLDVQVGMPGLFSIYNALATIGVGKVLGLADAPIHEGLKKALVKGRVELVPISHKFTILIDYAHNEAATESLIETLREYNPNRLVVVFGCGGNRSKLRRYGMGEVCAKLADFSILTEDNNRFEKVEDIIADIKTGMAKGNPDAKYVEIPDRLDALHYAIDHAQEGDLIAVIGKGHEAYRDREGVKTPFLERELIEEYAAETGVE